MTARFHSDLFIAQLKGLHGLKDEGKGKFRFESQDSQYRIHVPHLAKKSSTSSEAHDDGPSTMTVHLHQEHVYGGLTGSDTINLHASFAEPTAELVRLRADGKIGKEWTIPDWVPKLIDVTAEAMGLLLAPETAGLSLEAAAEVVEIVNRVCGLYNKAVTGTHWLFEDGGQLNFPAVAAHDLNRLINAVTTSEASDPSTLPSGIVFDPERFGDAMQNLGLTRLDRYDQHHGWCGKDQRYMTYRHPTDGGNYRYTTWKPDLSVCRHSLAAILSAKIDHPNTMGKADHAVVLGAFNREGHLLIAQAAVQSTPMLSAKKTARTQPVVIPSGQRPSADTDKAITDEIERQITEVVEKEIKGDDKDTGTLHLRCTARDFLLCATKAIVTT